MGRRRQRVQVNPWVFAVIVVVVLALVGLPVICAQEANKGLGICEAVRAVFTASNRPEPSASPAESGG